MYSVVGYTYYIISKLMIQRYIEYIEYWIQIIQFYSISKFWL